MNMLINFTKIVLYSSLFWRVYCRQIECLSVLILPLFIEGGAQRLGVQTRLFHFKVI